MDFNSLVYYRRPSNGWRKDPIACLYPRIYIGAGCQFTEELSKHRSFTHVINCATADDGPAWFAKKYPSNYAILNAVDALDVSILSWYPAFEATLLTFLRDPTCKNVYIHCQCGINRSAYLAIAFVCKRFGYPMAEVARSMISQRPCALSNPSFWTQVSAFLKPHG